MKILIIGPFPPPISGLSVVNRYILDKFKTNPDFSISFINTGLAGFSEDIGKFSFVKIFSFFQNYLQIYKVFSHNILYMTPGQTFFGVLKYLPFVLFGFILNKELIIHVHGDYIWQEYEILKGLKKQIYRFIISKFTKGIVLSEKLRRNLYPFLPESMIYILKNYYASTISEKGDLWNDKNFDSLRILFMSNLMEEKGIFDFLDALYILDKNGINYEANIAGALDVKNKNRFFSNLSKLNSNVKYHGVVFGNEKARLLHESNVFVFPTYYKMEGQPIVLLENIAADNIILCCNHAGIPEIFQDGITCYYIQPKQPKNIAEKLITISENLSGYIPEVKRNKKLAVERYNPDLFISNFINILES